MNWVDWAKLGALAVLWVSIFIVVRSGRRTLSDPAEEEYPGQRAYEEHKRMWRERDQNPAAKGDWEDTQPTNRRNS